MAEPLNVQAVMVPKEQIRLDFKDGSGHFLHVLRSKEAAFGTCHLNAAGISKFGRHDIVPCVSEDPSRYLVATKGERNLAYPKWTVKAIFLPVKDGKLDINDNGF